MNIRAVCPQRREMRLSMRSSPMSSQSAAFDDDAFSRSSKFRSISARCCARNSGAYSSRSSAYTTKERDRVFCLIWAMTSRGPQVAARDNGKTRQALRLRLQRRLSERRELVIDSARVARVAFGHEAGFDHAVERAVERSRPHFDGTLRVRLDLLHDVVAVPFLAEEGQQDVEHGRCQRQLGCGFAHAGHYISVTDIVKTCGTRETFAHRNG